MLAKEIIAHIESWAPPGVAWEKDNVGLQIGSYDSKIRNIFLALELNKQVFKEALRKDCNFIFTHHPFIFKPISKLNFDRDDKSETIANLITNNINLFAAHTNLDFTKDGVSFELAKVIGLKNLRFLENTSEDQLKVVVFVPATDRDKVAEAIFENGAGVIGEYTKCSFNLQGKGTFKSSANSNPVIGRKESYENVDEIRLEVVVNKWNLKKVITAIKASHPYEEPAFDVYPLKNENVNFGYGVIGELEKPVSKNDFLQHVCSTIKTKNLRYADGKNDKIKKVAVCGGSGAQLLNSALKAGADAFITADIKYHSFQDAEGKILFVDAGHYETEIHSLGAVKRKLNEFIKASGENIKVFVYKGTTNPVKFFNN